MKEIVKKELVCFAAKLYALSFHYCNTVSKNYLFTQVE